MKRTYRGTSYEVSTPVRHSSDPVDNPQIKLFYQGNVFNYIPRPVKIAQEWWPTVTLIYRGVSYERKIPPLKPYQKPRAINWRWNFG